MYATALACPGWRGSREPKLVSAMRWSFIFAGSIAAIAFAVELHSRSRWQGPRLGTGATDAPGPDEAGGAMLGEAAGGALPAGEGVSSTRAGPPQAAATRRSARTRPTGRTIPR